jgi:hypothetical protein
MKTGRYFTIPQNPADLDRLWQTGQPLDPAHLPEWAVSLDPSQYRQIGFAARRGGPLPTDYEAEVRALRDAGVIVDHATPGHGFDRFYLMDPKIGWFNEALWAIGIYTGTEPHQLAPAAGIINPVLTRDHITDIPAAFVADPFLHRVDGVWHLFVEVMNFATGKGDIGLAISRDGLHWNYQQIVLTEPFHLSYPSVFEHQGQHFMIPESHQAGAVRLYRADPFPLRWSLVTELIRAPYLADPSIFQHQGRWYMFIDTSTDLANDTLSLYHADRLTGPWQQHPCSPIIRFNPNTARPGGRVIHHAGHPIRFTQGCRPLYGTNVRAFEITELTPTTYQERELTQTPILAPAGTGWNEMGMHHVDAHAVQGGYLAAVDGWRTK